MRSAIICPECGSEAIRVDYLVDKTTTRYVHATNASGAALISCLHSDNAAYTVFIVLLCALVMLFVCVIGAAITFSGA